MIHNSLNARHHCDLNDFIVFGRPFWAFVSTHQQSRPTKWVGIFRIKYIYIYHKFYLFILANVLWVCTTPASISCALRLSPVFLNAMWVISAYVCCVYIWIKQTYLFMHMKAWASFLFRLNEFGGDMNGSHWGILPSTPWVAKVIKCVLINESISLESHPIQTVCGSDCAMLYVRSTFFRPRQ